VLRKRSAQVLVVVSSNSAANDLAEKILKVVKNPPPIPDDVLPPTINILRKFAPCYDEDDVPSQLEEIASVGKEYITRVDQNKKPFKLLNLEYQYHDFDAWSWHRMESCSCISS
jgi:hypothetical protein